MVEINFKMMNRADFVAGCIDFVLLHVRYKFVEARNLEPRKKTIQ
jgi:hypothetical protein